MSEQVKIMWNFHYVLDFDCAWNFQGLKNNFAEFPGVKLKILLEFPRVPKLCDKPKNSRGFFLKKYLINHPTPPPHSPQLLLNFKSFTSFSYKISLIKCLIDRSFKICNDWNSFHNNIENIKSNLIKNAYPPSIIDKVIRKF